MTYLANLLIIIYKVEKKLVHNNSTS